jgi:hypothetical protein
LEVFRRCSFSSFCLNFDFYSVYCSLRCLLLLLF